MSQPQTRSSVAPVRRAIASVTAAAAGSGGRAIFAVGDIHGRYDLLKQLLARIVADCLAEPPA
ncbi:MAG TPA: hypothetical protein VFE13_11280, partial [Caulobacteraceae bacterium]|nr:hypothetical protein [Caulobacteraceae bacterium]